jgi:TonB family protein
VTALSSRAEEAEDFIREPTPIRRVQAIYPLSALDRGLEGWVELAFTISPDGSTRDIAVTASAPPRVFDAAAAAALSRWIFDTEDGDRRHSTLMTFALLDAGASRTAVIDQLREAGYRIEENRVKDARTILERVTDLKDLTLVERGLIERVNGLASYAESDFPAAAASFARALSILGPKLDAQSLISLLRPLIVARVNASQFVEAVRDFDRWSPRAGSGLDDVAPKVEEIRAALRAGRSLQLAPPANLAGP